MIQPSDQFNTNTLVAPSVGYKIKQLGLQSILLIDDRESIRNQQSQTHATSCLSEIKTTRVKFNSFNIISVFFNENLEAKTQRYVTRAIMKLVAAKN